MTTPQITYRGMPHSPAMDTRISELVSKLDDLHPRITRCHVVIDEADRHKTKGNLFEVHVDLHVPGSEIVATRKASPDAYLAVNEAFEVVMRQLEDTIRRQRGDVKLHRGPETGIPPP
jgi:ribosome-associated translation inhibitor RaiA